MNLISIFKKPVDRSIEGVIKADDEASLRIELEEYVLTNEVEKRLEDFLYAYNQYEGANGVWISGFFGSGKSHLLKMLALLLENRAIDGIPALDLFVAKCEDNEVLRADLKRAASFPSKSILFNIDQKADVISKTQIDALLAVFVKVFDESCGYYGKQPYIAQFERELDREGLLDDFKTHFANLASNDWDWGRARPTRIESFVDQAYAKVTGQTVVGVLDKFRADYRLSIEDFANQVKAYVDKQSHGFRLNFFVDEVGQYIAGNTKLMTNLQTIAESLATKCKGQAWVIVTAQEEMSSIIGEMNTKESNDFSKIQARFANRMKLTSADVAEVIQKRLLLKDDTGIGLLSDVYHQQSNNFKTLFDFADGSQSYKNFKDRDHFIHCYPFIPYQFSLFQTSIQSLSMHNGFEGKHSSVGERSMLGVFQQVAIQIGSHKVGQLATFDLMFEGIRTALKSHIQRAIIQAENHLESPFAIKLLKALFLVKYVKEFKPTLRNMCVLMLEGFDQDMPQLRKRVEEALNLLEQQTYIQRNGEFYEYLTDEEKDVEQEIKNTEVETTDVATELEKIIFDHIIKNRKIRFDDNGQDYPYSRKLDDRLQGREYELAIHVVSPFHENAASETTLRMQSMGRDELLVVMPQEDRLIRDLLMYKRTEKYIRQNVSVTQQENVKRILTDKGFQNQERQRELQAMVQSLIGKSKLIISGGDVDVSSEDAQSRITKGFHDLIQRAYPNLRMLRGYSYTENEIGKFLKHSQEGLFGNDGTSLAESEQEMLSFVQSNSRGGVRTTLKGLIEKFERKPYGWYFAAVLCTLAHLCARGKIEVRIDGNVLEEDALERALRNTATHGNVVLEPQVDFTASQVRALREFYADFFDTPAGSGEAKALGKESEAAFKQLVIDLNELLVQSAQYPFLTALKPAIETLKEISTKPYTWHLTELTRQEDLLLDLKEKVIDPVRKFMATSSPLKIIFNEARKFVQNQEPNFTYINGDEAAQITGVLTDPDCYKGNRMQQLKTLVDSLQEKINIQISAEITTSQTSVVMLEQRLRNMSEFAVLNADQQAQITQPFAEFVSNITKQKLIAVIRDMQRRFEEDDYSRLLSRLDSLTRPAPPPSPAAPAQDESGNTSIHKPVVLPATAHKIDYVSSRNIPVEFDKAWLADETDVTNYLESMRKALLKAIREGKRVQI
ncbi:MAG: BREX system P-loop protein BrxC [Gallionella sp.]|jgi:hypothetical protein